MSEVDVAIGARVAAARDNMSQRQVARMMSAGGLRWTHLTVAAVESGKRPLRLSEAITIASVLSVPTAYLTGELQVQHSAEVAAAKRVLRAIQSSVHDAEMKGLI